MVSGLDMLTRGMKFTHRAEATTAALKGRVLGSEWDVCFEAFLALLEGTLLFWQGRLAYFEWDLCPDAFLSATG